MCFWQILVDELLEESWVGLGPHIGDKTHRLSSFERGLSPDLATPYPRDNLDLGQIIAHTQREPPPKLTWFWDRTYPELEISNTKKTYP